MSNPSNETNEMLLSVLIYTYNHAGYIEQCLDGIYSQKTDFKIELVIADNWSTDGSRQKIISYVEAHPSEIISSVRFFPQQENLGNRKNMIELIDYCQGKYIALLEGDDYWTDPVKLQMQVDFLEANAEYSMCCHEAGIFDQGSNRILKKRKRDPFYRDITTKEIILGGGSSVPTLSVVYRHEHVKQYPEWYMKMPIGDYPLFMMLASAGKVYRFAREMGVYRFNLSGNNWTSQFFKPESFRKRYNVHMAVIDGLKIFDKCTDYKYTDAVTTTMSARHLSLLLDNYDEEFRHTDLQAFHNHLKFSHRFILFASHLTPHYRMVWKLFRDISFVKGLIRNFFVHCFLTVFGKKKTV